MERQCYFGSFRDHFKVLPMCILALLIQTIQNISILVSIIDNLYDRRDYIQLNGPGMATNVHTQINAHIITRAGQRDSCLVAMHVCNAYFSLWE